MARERDKGSPSTDRTDSRLTSSPHLSGYDATEGGSEQCRALTPPQAGIRTEPMIVTPPKAGPSQDQSHFGSMTEEGLVRRMRVTLGTSPR